MRKVLYGLVERVARIYSCLLRLKDVNEYNITDKV